MSHSTPVLIWAVVAVACLIAVFDNAAAEHVDGWVIAAETALGVIASVMAWRAHRAEPARAQVHEHDDR